MKIYIDESYHTYDLDDEKQDELYRVFYDTYTASTGGAFSRNEFDSRASNWTFFGTPPNDEGKPVGGICLRLQNGGMAKVTGSFGDIHAVANAIREMESEIGDMKIWSAVPEKLAKAFCHFDKEFLIPPKEIVKILAPMIAKRGTVLGFLGVNPDGSLKFDTPSGQMDKVYVCNRNYAEWLIGQADNFGIPKMILNPLKAMLQKKLGLT